MNKQDVVNCLIGHKRTNPVQTRATVYAPVNFALIKYWGKDKNFEHLMLPLTSHLSVSMGKFMGTTTSIEEDVEDRVILDGIVLDKKSSFHKKVFDFVDLFRKAHCPLRITTINSMPTAAGLASSASGFAALVLALQEFYGWGLNKEQLSVLARLGSGSASRSVYENGFVEFVRGNRADTTDSVAQPFKASLSSLSVGLLVFDAGEKSVSSSKGMKQTVENSKLYQNHWQKQVAEDLHAMKRALIKGNFNEMGEIAQRNAMAMHATAHDAGVFYGNHETNKAIEKIEQLQKEAVPLYFTQDAGPNLKLLAEDQNVIKRYFPQAEVYTIL